MNCDEFDADQFVEFESTSSPELDEEFSTLYSNLENFVCATETKGSRTVTVTSEYIPSSVESSFELAEEHSTDFSNPKSEDNLEKALSEFIKFDTNPKTSSLELEKPCTQSQRHNTSVNLQRDSVAYRISSATTPLSDCESPHPERQNGVLNSDDYETSLNRTGQDSLIAAMKRLQIESSRKMKIGRKDFENLDGNSEIAIIVTPSGISESSMNSDKYTIDGKRVLWMDTSVSSKSDLENLSFTSDFAENQLAEGSFEIGEEMAKPDPSYRISETSKVSDKYSKDEKNALSMETSPSSKLDFQNSTFSSNFAENQTTEGSIVIGEEVAKTVPSHRIPEISDINDTNGEAQENAMSRETSLRSKSNLDNLLFFANIAENQMNGRTYTIGEEEIAKSSEEKQSPHSTETCLQSKSDIDNLLFLANIAENQSNGRGYLPVKEDNSKIAKTFPPCTIAESSEFSDKSREENLSTRLTEISLLSKPEMKNVSSSSDITKNKKTEKTRIIIEENSSEIAKTVPSCEISESSNIRDKRSEENLIALPTEPEMKNLPSSSNITKNKKPEETRIIVEEDNSEVAEEIDPSYEILQPSSPIEDIEETVSPIRPENSNQMGRDVADASSESVRPGGVPAEDRRKKRNTPRVLTSQVRRQSLKYRRSSGQFVSMAEAMLKFQKGTPKRFRSTVKKNPSEPAQPKIVKALQRATCPMSPNLRCKSRARPSIFPNREEREMLEIEEYRRNRLKETKSPGPQKSTEKSSEKSSKKSAEKSAPSTSRASNALSVVERRKSRQRATSRRKTLVKSVVTTEEGSMIQEVEIFNFGVPIQTAKSPLTKQEPFSFDKGEKRKTIHQRSAAATSTVTSGSLEGTVRRPIELSFQERNELLLAKKKLIADRAMEKKQAWVFHAKQAPPVKQVLVRGLSTENLGAAKAAQSVKQSLRRGPSVENLGAARIANSVKRALGRGTSMENLGAAKIANSVKQALGRGTSTENLGAAKIAQSVKQVVERRTSTENLDPAKVAPSVKLVPDEGTSKENLDPTNGTYTENSGLIEKERKARGLSPADRSRGLSPADRSRGLSPSDRSRGLSPADRSRGLSPADRSRGSSSAHQSRGLSPANRSRGLSPANRSRGLSLAHRSRGLSPADRSRGLSPANLSRGLSPAHQSRGLPPADRSRGLSSAHRSRGLSSAHGSRRLSPSIADRENRNPNVSPISNECPKLKAPLKLHTADRSKKRHEFDALMRRKELEAEEHRREYEAYQRVREEQEEKELRKTMEPQAKPMPVFRPPKIAKSLKPLTNPQSPAWSWKKSKK